MRHKRRWWKSPVILFVVFTMVIAFGGLVYAHWFADSSIQVNVQTGNVAMGWNNAGTNDDGMQQGNDPSGNDDGGLNATFDYWWNYEDPVGCGGDNQPQCSSDDPNSGSDPSSRYGKDVAGCWVQGDDGGDGPMGTVNVQIQNGYPSYYCHLFADAVNAGSVPTKAAALTLTAGKGQYEPGTWYEDEQWQTPLDPQPVQDENCQDQDASGFSWDGHCIYWTPDGPLVDANDDGPNGDPDFIVYFEEVFNGENLDVFVVGDGEFNIGDENDPDLFVNITSGIRCDGSIQFDPGGDGVPVSGYIHVENPAEQNAGYVVTLTQQWVNWNEWSEDLCLFNGEPIPTG